MNAPRPERLAQLRRLMGDDISLDRAWAEIIKHRTDEAAPTTVEALMLGLCSRGVQALGEPDTLHRLSDVNDTQLRQVAIRLQKLKPEIAQPWAPEAVAVLIAARRRLT